MHYSNGGFHNHPCLTHILHLSASEKAQFAEIVQNNPTAGPLKLLVGVPGSGVQQILKFHIFPMYKCNKKLVAFVLAYFISAITFNLTF